jgi:hypothetical protein
MKVFIYLKINELKRRETRIKQTKMVGRIIKKA